MIRWNVCTERDESSLEHGGDSLLLEIVADLLVVALELLVDVDKALRDGSVAVLTPGDRLVVRDEVMSAAEDVVVAFFVHLVAWAGLLLRVLDLPKTMRCFEDVVLSLERAALGVDIKVTEVGLCTVGFKHVLFVRLTILELECGAKLALEATALLAIFVQALEVPVLEVPVQLLFLLFSRSCELLVLLDDLVEE